MSTSEKKPRTRTRALGIQHLPWQVLFPNPNNRRQFKDDDAKDRHIVELARSIETHRGNFAPVIVSAENEKGMYQIVAGECRWRAVRWPANFTRTAAEHTRQWRV